MPPPSLLPTPRLPALLLLPTLLQLLPLLLLQMPTPRLPLLPLPLLSTLPPVLPLPPLLPLFFLLPLLPLAFLSRRLELHAPTATAAAMQRPSAPSGRAAAAWRGWWGAAPVLRGVHVDGSTIHEHGIILQPYDMMLDIAQTLPHYSWLSSMHATCSQLSHCCSWSTAPTCSPCPCAAEP